VMSRTASGQEVLEQAKACLVTAKTVNALRQAQAVVLPLELGLSLEQTSQLLGVSEGWACQLRSRFIRNGGQLDEAAPGRGGRRRENLSREEEAAFLAPYLEQAKAGEILVVSEIKRALDERLGRVTALASVYNLLHRHGWRKLAPDKRHPKSDPVAQEAWKKNFRKPLLKSTGNGRAKGPSD
jgi:transposase